MAVKSLSTKELTKKLTIEVMSALYDRIYDIADRLLKKYNPCNINIKSQPYCTGDKPQIQLCCGSCKHWNKGCTIKSLVCKLFLCYRVEYDYKLLCHRFKILKHYADKYFSYGNYPITDAYYYTKEYWLNLLKEFRLVEQLLKYKFLTGHKQIIYRCSHGCIINKEDITIIQLKKKTILRCPYCNSDKLKQV